MSKTLYLIAGAAIGAAVGLAYDYLFSPANATKFDKSYRSRWDWALDEGEKAAAARELELRAQFEAAKRNPPPRTAPAPSDNTQAAPADTDASPPSA